MLSFDLDFVTSAVIFESQYTLNCATHRPGKLSENINLHVTLPTRFTNKNYLGSVNFNSFHSCREESQEHIVYIIIFKFLAKDIVRPTYVYILPEWRE